jgi:uncharacterized membrane protein
MRRFMILSSAALLIWVASAAPVSAAAPTRPPPTGPLPIAPLHIRPVPAQTPPAANATYTTIDYPGANWTNANGINRYGRLQRSVEIVGTYGDIQGHHGFLLSGGHYTKLDVPVPYARETQPLSINALHQVAGTYVNGQTGDQCGFLYSQGTYNALQSCVPYGFGNPRPYGINNSGKVVGSYDAQVSGMVFGKLEGFVGSTNGAFGGGYDFAGDLGSEIYGINNTPIPQMVGSYTDSSNIRHGAVWTGTHGTTLDVPGASRGTMATGINSSGQIVGIYNETRCITWDCANPLLEGGHGFVDDNGAFSTINYPGAWGTIVNGVNDSNSVVGDGYDVVGSYEAAGTTTAGGSILVRGQDHGFVASIASVAGRAPSPPQ